jgi:hypothetical protein
MISSEGNGFGESNVVCTGGRRCSSGPDIGDVRQCRQPAADFSLSHGKKRPSRCRAEIVSKAYADLGIAVIFKVIAVNGGGIMSQAGGPKMSQSSVDGLST